MRNESGKFIVLNPMEGPAKVEAKLAPRLTSLEGKVLAVINNGKRNSDVFLRFLLDGIKRRYDLKEVIWVDKVNTSLPIPDETIQRLKSCQAAIAGVGD